MHLDGLNIDLFLEKIKRDHKPEKKIMFSDFGGLEVNYFSIFSGVLHKDIFPFILRLIPVKF